MGARLKQMLRRYSIDVKLYIYIGSFFVDVVSLLVIFRLLRIKDQNIDLTEDVGVQSSSSGQCSSSSDSGGQLSGTLGYSDNQR